MEKDYGVGRLVQAVPSSAYWKDTAISIIEDEARSGPDRVDSHRSVALAISAYNRPGARIHKFHNTVSMIRTIEVLLGIAPMDQLDASAIPMDIFLVPVHGKRIKRSAIGAIAGLPSDAPRNRQLG